MSNRIFSDYRKITSHREIRQNQLRHPSLSHRARLSGEFDSRKELHSTKLERRPQIFVKLSFGEFCGSKLSGLHPFDNMAIMH